MLKDLPRYECLLAAAERFPGLEPSAHESFLNLLRTADLVFAETRRFLTKQNLSQGRFTVLTLLLMSAACPETQKPNTPARLADQASVTRATMTGLLDTLEKDGLAIREADAHDRRTTLVRLTERGHAFVESILPEWFQSISATMHPLDKSERKELVRLLQKIQEGLTPGKSAPSSEADPLLILYVEKNDLHADACRPDRGQHRLL
jgi:DNA-binding MarR family transcriptional regulator